MQGSILIVGEADLLKELLCEALKERLGVECAVVQNLYEAAPQSESAAMRLVLLDDSHPNVDEHLRNVRLAASVKHISHIIALYNVRAGCDIEREALQQGVKGFFYPKDSIDLIGRGIKALFGGEIWVPRQVLTRIAVSRADGKHTPSGADAQDVGLTRREMEILSCVAVGWTNDEIASRLSLSSHTVKTHLYRIYKKIHVVSRLQAALWAANRL